MEETNDFINKLDNGDESQLNYFFTDALNLSLDWNIIIKHNFKDKQMELFLKGYIYQFKLINEKDDPIKYFLESGNKYAYFALAYIYYLKNDLKNVKKYFKLSKYHESYYNLGCIYFHQYLENNKLKTLQKSIKYFKFASDENNEAAYYCIGYIFETCSDINEIYHSNYIKTYIIENYLMAFKLDYQKNEIKKYFENNIDDLIEYMIYQKNKISNIEYMKKYLLEDHEIISKENINLKLKLDMYENFNYLEECFNKL
jgi:hypothetical protein